MDRRQFLQALAATTTTGLIPACVARHRGIASGSSRRRPNIVLIMADDIGVEGIGCYGSTSYATPELDGLANAGVRFSNTYSQPLCTPSRVKLMTGQSNIRNYSGFSILDPDQQTFGHLMQRAGYRTAVAGKWQLYAAEHYGELAGTGMHPSQSGFDEYCLWQVDKLGSRYHDPLITRNGRQLEDTSGKYGPDIFTDFILDFVARHRAGPFFVYYPMALVHDPFVPTPDSANRDSSDRQRNFADMVAYMDKIVGRIARRLDELELREDTLLLFTSDNGTHKSITSRMGDLNVRGGKGKTTDAGTHVPLIASWPGRTPRGAVCEDLVDFSDFVPTLASVAGAMPPTGTTLDGRSFLPQIRGWRGDPREWIFCYHNPRPGNPRFVERRFARDRRWKLYGDGRLFDLLTDPLELKTIPVAGQTPEAAAARGNLRSAIDSFPREPQSIRR